MYRGSKNMLKTNLFNQESNIKDCYQLKFFPKGESEASLNKTMLLLNSNKINKC